MLSQFRNGIGRVSRTIASPKTAAVLGVCVAVFQLCMALEDLRKSKEGIGFKPARKRGILGE